MPPKLIALTGPSRGKSCELTDKQFIIGRNYNSQLCLNDRLVTDKHAVTSQIITSSRSGIWARMARW